MSWPEGLSAERYPGSIRREITVESFIEGDRLVFDAVLRDRWRDVDTGEEEEIHGYEVRLEAEPPDLTIVAVRASPGHLPFPTCPSAAATVGRLVGLNMTQGFNKAAASALRGVEGCTHLLTIVQTISGQRVVANYLRSRVELEITEESRARRESMVDVCAGWQEGGVAITLSRAGSSLGRSTIHPQGPFSAEAVKGPTSCG
jgi:hypothetical protein